MFQVILRKSILQLQFMPLSSQINFILFAAISAIRILHCFKLIFFLISSWRGYINHLRIYRKGGRLCKHENKYNWFMVLKIRLLLYNFHHIELTYIYLFITLFYNSNLLNSSWKSPSLRYLQSTNCFVSGFDIVFDMFKTKLYQSLEKCETIENANWLCKHVNHSHWFLII